MAPLALPAHDVVLHENQVAFSETLASGELAARLGDVTDILVTHDHRGFGRWLLIHLDIRSTNTAHLHLQQSAILRDIRHGKLANLRLTRTHSYRRQHSFQRCFLREELTLWI